MDIHKPKAAHSWREFAIEIGTIICGILIALGLEQIVDAVRIRTEIAEAHEALRAELATNASVAQYTLDEEVCLTRQLNTYEAWASGGPHPGPIVGSFPPMASTTWDMVKTTAVPHMPLKERLGYAGQAALIINMDWAISNERGVFLRLVGISRRPSLSTEHAGRLLEDIAQARLVGRVRVANAVQFLRMAKAMNVVPQPYSQGQTRMLAGECGRGADQMAVAR